MNSGRVARLFCDRHRTSYDDPQTRDTAEDTMTTTPNDPTTALPGRPPVVDLATWQTARDALLVREKAHTREGDALAAARRRLPMVELDGAVEVVGPDGPVPFLDLFQGRNELVVYKHMWYDGAPHQGQCEGCTTTAWHLKDAVYLNARGVSFAILTTGRWDEVASYVEFMGYTQPWYSVRGMDEPVGDSMGYITCFLRDGDRVFLTYSTTGRGQRADQRVPRPARHDALRPRRGVAGQPRRLARGAQPVLVLALGRGRERHLGPDQPPRAAVDSPRRDPGGDPRPARPPPLTRLRRRRRQKLFRYPGGTSGRCEGPAVCFLASLTNRYTFVQFRRLKRVKRGWCDSLNRRTRPLHKPPVDG
jgi:Bacterial protein of unknown function (DUF899)